MISLRWLLVLAVTGVAALLLAERADAQLYVAVPPCRVVDTRQPANAPALQNGVERFFTIVEDCAIPATATAVALNVSVTQATGAGSLMMYPGGTSAPGVSLLHFGPGQSSIVSAAATLPLGNDGLNASATVAGSGAVHLIINVYGYYTPGS